MNLRQFVVNLEPHRAKSDDDEKDLVAVLEELAILRASPRY